MIGDPPAAIISTAVGSARMSPCAKTKRGAVAYLDYHMDGTITTIIGTGFNGPPDPIECLANDDCRRDCGKRCGHAEERALREASRSPRQRASIVLLHVKIEHGELVAGAGPGCWQCSREMLDAKTVHGIWLFQTGESRGAAGKPDSWRYWEAEEFHRETCRAVGIV